MEIPKTLKDEIWDYCRLNNISDIDGFTIKLLKAGFTVEKYGATPTSNVGTPSVIEKEVIKEVIVEKEVVKEVIVSDDVKINELLEQISSFNAERTELQAEIDTLGEAVGKAQAKILELSKEKQETGDIYNEKRATFGSNLLDKK